RIWSSHITLMAGSMFVITTVFCHRLAIVAGRMSGLYCRNTSQFELCRTRPGFTSCRRRLYQRALNGLQCQFGCSLFTGTPATTSSEYLDIQLGHQTFNLEFLIMRSTMCCNHVVLRQWNFFPLQIFLQQCLGVFTQG